MENIIDISKLKCPYTLMKLRPELSKIQKGTELKILFNSNEQPLKNLSDCLIEEDCKPGKIEFVKDSLYYFNILV